MGRELTRALVALCIALGASSAAAAPGERDVTASAARLRAFWQRGLAKSMQITMPLYGRQLRFDLPAGYVPIYEAVTPERFTLEHIPDGETLDNWTSMITIRAFAGGGRLPLETTAMAEQLLRPKSCASEPLYEDLGAADLGPGLETRIVTFGCGDTGVAAYAGAKTGLGEQDFGYVARSADHLYLVLFARRGPAFAADRPPVAGKEHKTALAPLGNVVMCGDDSAGDCRKLLLLEKARKALGAPKE